MRAKLKACFGLTSKQVDKRWNLMRTSAWWEGSVEELLRHWKELAMGKCWNNYQQVGQRESEGEGNTDVYMARTPKAFTKGKPQVLMAFSMKRLCIEDV